MARSHLGACADCRRRVEDGRADEADFVAWLAELDPPPLELSVESVLAKATRTPELSRWGRRAAAIVLAMGVAGGAYAMPGSPFPAWIDAWLGAEGEAPQASPAVASPPEARAGGGIAVDPGVRLTVVFSDLAPGATATVTVAESPNVVVQAENGTVSFDSDEDRLLIYGGASAAELRHPLARQRPGHRDPGGRASPVGQESRSDRDGRYVGRRRPILTAPGSLKLHPDPSLVFVRRP